MNWHLHVYSDDTKASFDNFKEDIEHIFHVL